MEVLKNQEYSAKKLHFHAKFAGSSLIAMHDVGGNLPFCHGLRFRKPSKFNGFSQLKMAVFDVVDIFFVLNKKNLRVIPGNSGIPAFLTLWKHSLPNNIVDLLLSTGNGHSLLLSFWESWKSLPMPGFGQNLS